MAPVAPALPSLDLELYSTRQPLPAVVQELLHVVRMTEIPDRHRVAKGLQGDAGAVIVEQPLFA